MTRLSIARVGNALGLFFAALFVLCVVWDGIFSGQAMRSVWAPALPWFGWLSAGDFLLGLVEAFLYGWIAAVLFVPIWNWVGAEKPASSRAPVAHGPEAHAH